MKATFKQMRKWKLREVTGLWSLFGKWSNKNSMPGSCDSLACAITYAPALLSPPVQGAQRVMEQAHRGQAMAVHDRVGSPCKQGHRPPAR